MGRHHECEFAYQFRGEDQPHRCRLPEGHESNHECRTCGLIWTRSTPADYRALIQFQETRSTWAKR